MIDNLLKETIETLAEHGKSLADVVWFGTEKARIDCDINVLLDGDYDSGYGTSEIPQSFIIVGSDFWLERHEYDGSEWWEYKAMPKMPVAMVKCNDVMRIA